MTSVHIITEDKTGGGLEAIIKAEVAHQRMLKDLEPLEFSKVRGTVNGNAELLKQCEKYELFRFRYPKRFDHVLYVIDARNAWKLKQLGVAAPQQPYENSLPPFCDAIREKLELLAKAERTDEQWQPIRSGFHAHVLVWERESLILPVADQLGLGPAVADVYADRGAAESVTHRFEQTGKKRAYSKATDGKQFLDRIAYTEGLRTTVVGSNPSLQAIVDELVAL
ncbi:hypothetical protein [Archangium sp.]|uniref:hypothetical protein n=1 Tax=Archangium sp. TaxID=1872627 RepID=UPI00286C1282|nr:hypothetical protein [Archangium sp.]